VWDGKGFLYPTFSFRGIIIHLFSFDIHDANLGFLVGGVWVIGRGIIGLAPKRSLIYNGGKIVRERHIWE